jgi:hypothetical protein
MTRFSWSLQLVVPAVLVFGCALGAALPADAQDTQSTPWYLPQPWVHPTTAAPSVPGSYDYSFLRAYGSFSRACYGSCRIVRGAIATGNGVVLFRPKPAVYDHRSAEIMWNSYLAQLRQDAAREVELKRRLVQPTLVPVRTRAPKSNPPRVSMQNGVRIIRPIPVER